jgi:riboflavin biosynthesis pyrimidine reductase
MESWEELPVNDNIIQLYPDERKEVPFKNLYLQHNLRQSSSLGRKPFVYTNFITSLDGRIAIARDSDSGMQVPKSIANPRDWRLFQELALQADVLITTGRYLRDYASGQAQEILKISDDPLFADLKGWRKSQGLPPFPALAIISASLDFIMPEILVRGDRKVHVITTQNADPARIVELQDNNVSVLTSGENEIDGKELIHQLGSLGYHTIYSTAGPKIMHLLISNDVLDRLYLTYTSRILGGDPFASIMEGAVLIPAVDFKLKSLFLDPQGLDGLGQLFACYDRAV